MLINQLIGKVVFLQAKSPVNSLAYCKQMYYFYSLLLNCCIANIMEKLLLSFLKPQVHSYSASDLGPCIFQVNNKFVKRTDHMEQKTPFSYYSISDHRPAVLYIHSYNSNRLEPMTLLSLLLEQDFNVISIELQRVAYSESLNQMEANSEGVISFGYYECQQVAHVVKWYRENSKERMYIWGRSMGAVTALLYQSKYKGVNGLILDSPFHSLYEIFVSQIVNLTGLPRFIAESVVFIANSSYRNLLKYDIKDMDILQLLNINCPAFIIVNPKDALAGSSCNLIYSKCKGLKKMLFSEAEHSASREQSILLEIISHLNKLEKPPKQYCLKKMSKGIEVNYTSKTEENEIEVKQRPKRHLFLSLVQSQCALRRV